MTMKEQNSNKHAKMTFSPFQVISKFPSTLELRGLATSLSNLFSRTSHQGQLELVLKQLNLDGSFVKTMVEQYHAGVGA